MYSQKRPKLDPHRRRGPRLPRKFNSLARNWHAIIAIWIAIPFGIMIISGILLQWKKHVDWIQPPAQTGSGIRPELSFDSLLTVLALNPKTKITSWQDVERIDVRPSKGMAKVTSVNGYETQVDLKTGEILQVAYRRSDIIEAIHDGSWFHEYAKLGLFFPAALGLLFLYVSGLLLYFGTRGYRK